MGLPDTDAFRHVLGHLPTGVTVITAIEDGAPVGMAVGTFSSLSLDPALVLFCPAKSSTTWPRIAKSGNFCANVLAAGHGHVSDQFARRTGDKFDGLGWYPAASGSPVLDDAVAWVDCTINGVHDGGDHVIVIGEVLDLAVGRGESPLVFVRGNYGEAALVGASPTPNERPD